MASLGCGQKAGDETTGKPIPPTLDAGAAASKAEEKPPGVLPLFQAIGSEAGLGFQRVDDISGQRRILEVNGGGTAMIDFDLDGLLDVFFTNGCKLPVDPGDRESPSRLFRNLGQFRFHAVPFESGLKQYGYSYGCAAGDFDADGFEDLYVTAYGRNTLWHNNGDGTFIDMTEVTGTSASGWSASAAFSDFNGDGHLDLYVVNYLAESDRSPTLCPHPDSPTGYISCPPSRIPGEDDVLLLSDGQGRFLDATKAAGFAGLQGKGLGVVVSDLDRDGDQEIYVANDGEANFLFTINGQQEIPFQAAGKDASASPILMKVPRYEDRAVFSGIALNEFGYAQASMGIAIGDYDGNGWQDLYLTHFFGDTNTLYANSGELMFEERTRQDNLGPSSRSVLGWGTIFFDADNDGWLDLFVANGHVEDRNWQGYDEPYAMPPLFHSNRGHGEFVDVSKWSGEYFLKHWLGRGAAAGDLDRDGKIDLAVSHQLAPSVVLRNATQTDRQSITLKFAGRDTNRDGFGVIVEVLGQDHPIVHELSGGGSFQSASAREIHLGLGKAPNADLRIHWPNSEVQNLSEVTAGRWLVVEGQGLWALP